MEQDLLAVQRMLDIVWIAMLTLGLLVVICWWREMVAFVIGAAIAIGLVLGSIPLVRWLIGGK